MRFAVALIVALVSCGGGSQTSAASATANTAVTPTCIDTAMTTHAMRVCMDAALEATHAQISHLLDSARRVVASPTALDSAQSAWITYRAAQCDAEGAEFAGGTMEGVTVLGCHQTLGLDRIKVLQSQLNSVVR